ncbi:cytosolic protein [Bacillaceae bacterium SIJ1]|uniref:spore coat protein YlbD n=1 Tax=Litoribacterium kuwaitense TaxID=1398745 RepID=UPI0013EC70EE|nr:spore coat protein YlbD [Litoribacterium kuwaitense]NGP44367.1 cytosolic protein [Litoribacterium kuwaitense]
MPSKEETLHAFKTFVKAHPGLGEEVKRNKRTWQHIFEDWYLLGEDDEQWAQYTKATKKEQQDVMKQAMDFLKNMDAEDIQKKISSVSTAIENIQQVLKQFQGSQSQALPRQQNNRAFERTHGRD